MGGPYANGFTHVNPHSPPRADLQDDRPPGMSLLLGIDEGTSAVKAVLFDAALRPIKEARRDKPLVHPKPGWVEQDPEVIVEAVVSAVAELLADEPDVDACALGPQGASIPAWERESGRALTPVVTWQDKRSQEVLDRL